MAAGQEQLVKYMEAIVGDAQLNDTAERYELLGVPDELLEKTKKALWKVLGRRKAKESLRASFQTEKPIKSKLNIPDDSAQEFYRLLVTDINYEKDQAASPTDFKNRLRTLSDNTWVEYSNILKYLLDYENLGFPEGFDPDQDPFSTSSFGRVRKEVIGLRDELKRAENNKIWEQAIKSLAVIFRLEGHLPYESGIDEPSTYDEIMTYYEDHLKEIVDFIFTDISQSDPDSLPQIKESKEDPRIAFARYLAGRINQYVQIPLDVSRDNLKICKNDPSCTVKWTSPTLPPQYQVMNNIVNSLTINFKGGKSAQLKKAVEDFGKEIIEATVEKVMIEKHGEKPTFKKSLRQYLRPSLPRDLNSIETAEMRLQAMRLISGKKEERTKKLRKDPNEAEIRLNELLSTIKLFDEKKAANYFKAHPELNKGLEHKFGKKVEDLRSDPALRALFAYVMFDESGERLNKLLALFPESSASEEKKLKEIGGRLGGLNPLKEEEAFANPNKFIAFISSNLSALGSDKNDNREGNKKLNNLFGFIEAGIKTKNLFSQAPTQAAEVLNTINVLIASIQEFQNTYEIPTFGSKKVQNERSEKLTSIYKRLNQEIANFVNSFSRLPDHMSTFQQNLISEINALENDKKKNLSEVEAKRKKILPDEALAAIVSQEISAQNPGMSSEDMDNAALQITMDILRRERELHYVNLAVNPLIYFKTLGTRQKIAGTLGARGLTDYLKGRCEDEMQPEQFLSLKDVLEEISKSYLKGKVRLKDKMEVSSLKSFLTSEKLKPEMLETIKGSLLALIKDEQADNIRLKPNDKLSVYIFFQSIEEALDNYYRDQAVLAGSLTEKVRLISEIRKSSLDRRGERISLIPKSQLKEEKKTKQHEEIEKSALFKVIDYAHKGHFFGKVLKGLGAIFKRR